MDGELPEPREQARQVRTAIKQHQGALQENDTWYVLSMRWWDLWKDHTRYVDSPMDTDDPNTDSPPQRRQLSGAAHAAPPSIDNAELCEEGQPAGRLRRGLQEYSDFMLIHSDAWQLLVRWYKGGPPLARSVVALSSSELRVDLYPLCLSCVLAGPAGELEATNSSLMFPRSGTAGQLLTLLSGAKALAETPSEEMVRTWYRPEGDDLASIDGWQRLVPLEKTMEDLRVRDGAVVVLEVGRKSASVYRNTPEWPFFRRLRIEQKRRRYKVPAEMRLCDKDEIDAAVEGQSAGYSYEGKVLTWYPATVVGEEEDRVLVQFHGREKPRSKLPPLLTDGGWLSERQLTPEIKGALEVVFKRYATDGRIDKGAMRGLMSCATNMLVQEDSWQVTDLLRQFGDGASVELEGFLKYWRGKATNSSSYWLEEELSRLFDRVGATPAALSEEEKLLSEGKEWLPRNSVRLAQFRSREYPHSVNRNKRGFRDFRRYDGVDAEFLGEWRQCEISEINWEEMAVLVVSKDAPKKQEWFAIESESLAEYQTKSLEAKEDDLPPVLARTVSKGGVCARPGACGLSNLGNTCFMNATLQCLSNCSDLRAFFTNATAEQRAPFANQLSNSPLSLKGRLAREFSRLLCNMWSNVHESCAPAELKALIGQKRPEFGGYQQQDAQELLIFLLDGLHEDVNRAPYPREIVAEVESDGRPDDVVAGEAWRGHLKRNDSRIVELFQFQIRSEVECPECHNISVTFDPIMYLSLPVPKPPHAVSLTVVPFDYPKAPMVKLEVAVPKGSLFSELESALWEQLHRSPAELPSVFVFADVWSDRVFKTFSREARISEIQQGDNVYALEVRMSEDRDVTFVPVLFRKQQKNAYASNAFSYDRIAPPRLLAVGRSATNADVHAQLGALARELLEVLGQSSAFDLVTQVDSYAATRGETLRLDDGAFAIASSQHVGVNFLEAESVANLHLALPKLSTSVAGQACCGVTLQQCLLKNSEREQLSEEDAVYCRKCKKHQRCWKKIELWSLPSQLIVHLKRFGRDRIDGPMTKITTAVDFPLELDLSPYLAKASSGATYELCGVVNHHGGLGGGHYTAHAAVTGLEGEGEREWFSFNDSRVSKSSSGEVDFAAGYILFYSRKAPA